MTTEPGVLPKNYEELDFREVSGELASAMLQVQNEVKRLEIEEEAESASGNKS